MTASSRLVGNSGIGTSVVQRVFKVFVGASSRKVLLRIIKRRHARAHGNGIFQGLAKFGNPALLEFGSSTTVLVEGGDCREDQGFTSQLFQPKATTPCTLARSFLAANGVPYGIKPGTDEMKLIIGQSTLTGFSEPALRKLLIERGMPMQADPARINSPMVVLMLWRR